MLFGDPSPEPKLAWHGEPNYRGTFGILSSCIITLGLCVWTAVHLNIPAHEATVYRAYDPRGLISVQKWRKLGWVLMGMLAPEMVAFAAFVQRHHASSLCRHMKRHLGNPKSTRQKAGESDLEVDLLDFSRSEEDRRYPWTSTHSFYAVMGGFVFDTSDVPEEKQFLPLGKTQISLTPKALLFLAQNAPTLLPDLPKAAILDKSKASGLTKALVCFQAAWFITQCIARLAEGLPITLLELNTLAHTVCALLVYTMWWNKPLDVEQPTAIKGPAMYAVCAYLCLHSQCDPVRKYIPLHDVQYTQKPDPSLMTRNLLLSGDMATRVKANKTSTAADRLRVELATTAAVTLPVEKGEDILKWRIPNWQAELNYSIGAFIIGEYDLDRESVAFIVAATAAGLMYGGIHLLAWNAPFSSSAQRILWRLSGIVIAASGPSLLLQQLGMWVIRKVHEAADGWLGGVFFIWAVLYFVARVFLVVECFLSLPYAQDLVFQQLRWAGYIPHIS